MKCRPKSTSAIWMTSGNTNITICLYRRQIWTVKEMAYPLDYHVAYKNIAINMSKQDFKKYFEMVGDAE